MRLIAACTLLAAASGLGCSSGALPSDDVVVLADPLTCSSASWNVVHDFGGLPSVPQSLNARNGTLSLSVDGLGIVSLPAAGGEPTVLTPDLAHTVWLSGANIYYTNLGGVLMRLPIEGGTSTVVLDARAPWMNPSQWASGVALDANYFYWTLTPQSGMGDGQLERTALADLTTTPMATLPGRVEEYNGYAAPLWAASADTFFMAPAANGVTYAVPLSDGSTMRTLAAPLTPGGAAAYALGVNTGGILWSVEWGVTKTATNPLDSKSSLALSGLADPAGAATRPFWSRKPAGLRPGPGATFADGNGGWIVTGIETLADGSRHVSAWSVDAGGNGARLGCGPALPAYFANVSTAAVTSDAIYAVVESEQDLPEVYFNYALVRFDRK